MNHKTKNLLILKLKYFSLYCMSTLLYTFIGMCVWGKTYIHPFIKLLYVNILPKNDYSHLCMIYLHFYYSKIVYIYCHFCTKVHNIQFLL